MSVLSDIRTSRRGSKLRQVFLDGEPWREASSEALAQAGLHVGDEVDAADVETRLAAVEPVAARERALRLLTYRERSVATLEARLIDDGYPPEVARAVVADLCRVGLVDDERFAHSLARTLTQARGLGRARVLRELAQAGIWEELALVAADEALPQEAEIEAAERLAARAAARSGATVDKVAARLLRRGYRPAVALAAARAALDAAGRPAREDGSDPFDF